MPCPFQLEDSYPENHEGGKNSNFPHHPVTDFRRVQFPEIMRHHLQKSHCSGKFSTRVQGMEPVIDSFPNPILSASTVDAAQRRAFHSINNPCCSST